MCVPVDGLWPITIYNPSITHVWHDMIWCDVIWYDIYIYIHQMCLSYLYFGESLTHIPYNWCFCPDVSGKNTWQNSALIGCIPHADLMDASVWQKTHPKMPVLSMKQDMNWLVVWLPFFCIFPLILGFCQIIPIDELVFFRTGWPWPTNQIWGWLKTSRNPTGRSLSRWVQEEMRAHEAALQMQRVAESPGSRVANGSGEVVGLGKVGKAWDKVGESWWNLRMMVIL